MNPIKIEEALQRASFRLKDAGIEQSRAEAELLLAFCMQTERLQLYLMRTEIMSPEIDIVYRELVERRCSGEPAAYITGEKYFYGRRFLVNRAVLIPRPETEMVIESALKWSALQMKQGQTGINCIDLGTGSGILAITLAIQLPASSITAVDISAAALVQAGINAAEYSVEDKITWYRGSYFDALKDIRPKPFFNLVVSNPPYISSEEMANLPQQIKDHEPIEALHGGEDGLDSYRAILSKLAAYIQRPGLLLLEIGAGQKDRVEKLCLQTGLFRSINWRCDLAGHPRVMEGEINSAFFLSK